MAEIEAWKDPEKAENQLLEIIRGGDVDQFTLKISRIGMMWTVRMEWHGQKIVGTGPNFAEAWHGQEPIGAHDVPSSPAPKALTALRRLARKLAS
jgi:hypothetical protein